MTYLTDYNDPEYPGKIGYCEKCGMSTRFQVCWSCFTGFLSSGLRDITAWLTTDTPLPPLAQAALDAEERQVVKAQGNLEALAARVVGNLPSFPLDPCCAVCCRIMSENNSQPVRPILTPGGARTCTTHLWRSQTLYAELGVIERMLRSGYTSDEIARQKDEGRQQGGAA